MNWLSNILGGGVVKSIENIATEFIETDMESAESKALMVKTLDPNGLMRRDISQKVSSAYMVYLFITMLLVLCQSFSIGNTEQIKEAIDSLTDLFIPITSMFTAIVGASFGVNGLNSHKGK